MQNFEIYNFDVSSHFEKMTGKWSKWRKTDFFSIFRVYFEYYSKSRQKLIVFMINYDVKPKVVQYWLPTRVSKNLWKMVKMTIFHFFSRKFEVIYIC